jgi:hypothetical protein
VCPNLREEVRGKREEREEGRGRTFERGAGIESGMKNFEFRMKN